MQRRVHIRVASVLVVAAWGLVALPGGRPAAAVQGVALDRPSIHIDDDLLREHSYELPPLLVINPGDERSVYRMYVEVHTMDGRAAADPRWFTFEPAEFTLDPQTSQPVTVRIVVDASAPPDAYSARIGAGVVVEGDGTRIGVAAAAPVTFDVRSTNAWEDLRRSVEDLAGSSLLYVALGVIAVGVGLVAWRLRRMRLRLEWRQ